VYPVCYKTFSISVQKSNKSTIDEMIILPVSKCRNIAKSPKTYFLALCLLVLQFTLYNFFQGQYWTRERESWEYHESKQQNITRKKEEVSPGNNSSTKRNRTHSMNVTGGSIHANPYPNHTNPTNRYDDEQQEKFCLTFNLLESPRLIRSTDFASERPPGSQKEWKKWEKRNYNSSGIPFHLRLKLWRNYVGFNYSEEQARNLFDYEIIRDEKNLDSRVAGDTSNAAMSALFRRERVSAPVVHNAAICLLEPNHLQFHFPHLMEVIFMCFDYWINRGCDWSTVNKNTFESENGKNLLPQPYPLLLYEDSRGYKKIWNMRFGKGALNFLKASMGLTTISLQDYYRCHHSYHKGNINTTSRKSQQKDKDSICTKFFHPDQTIRSTRNIKIYLFQHSKEWNEMMNIHLNETTAVASRRDDASCDALPPPKIGILNRK